MSRGTSSPWGEDDWRLEASHEPDDDALDLDVPGEHPQRLHALVCRLQAHVLPLGIEALEGRLVADQYDGHLATPSFLATLYYNQISIVDTLIDHRVADHLEHIVLSGTAIEQMLGHTDRLVPCDNLDRPTCRDQPEEGKLLFGGSTRRTRLVR